MIPNGSGFGDPMDRHYDGDREHWSVDFTAVVSGFLTVAGPITGFEGLAQTADVVDNFLRYVLHHDVCPEYSQDIRKAIDVCEAARDEWPLLASFSSVLPGTFNLALAHAFGVYEANDWPFAEAMDAKAKDEAQMIWLTILALSGQKDLCDLAFTNRHLCRVSREVQCDLEVTAINRLSRDEKEEAKTARIGDTVLAPVGRVDLEPTTIQDGWVYPVRAQHPPGWKTSVFFEEPILDHLRVGNKMSVTLCEVQLDGSSKTPAFAFVKTVHDILPTFYTFLPQQLMRHFKAPKEMDWQAPDADEDQQAPDAKEDE